MTPLLSILSGGKSSAFASRPLRLKGEKPMDLSFRASAAALLFAALAVPASAQRPIEVFGTGYARECFQAVKKNRLFNARALELCDAALEQEPLQPFNRAATHINRGILYMRQQSHTRAMKDYEAGLALMPDMPEARINIGAALYYLGRYSEAVAALDQGVRADLPETRAAAFYNRALANEQLGNLEAAYADYGQALASDPEFEPAAKQLKRFTRMSATP
jgi:tetratricopeptide (TPR) repeat protein